MSVDKRGMLDEQPFDYKVFKDGKLHISWNNKTVLILKGKKSDEILKKLEGADDKEAQLVLAKVTGNFKRGNERISKNTLKYWYITINTYRLNQRTNTYIYGYTKNIADQYGH